MELLRKRIARGLPNKESHPWRGSMLVIFDAS